MVQKNTIKVTWLLITCVKTKHKEATVSFLKFLSWKFSNGIIDSMHSTDHLAIKTDKRAKAALWWFLHLDIYFVVVCDVQLRQPFKLGATIKPVLSIEYDRPGERSTAFLSHLGSYRTYPRLKMKCEIITTERKYQTRQTERKPMETMLDVPHG